MNKSKLTRRDEMIAKYGRLVNARGECQCMYCTSPISRVYHQCLHCHAPTGGDYGYCIYCDTGQFQSDGIAQQLPKIPPARNLLAQRDHQLFDLLKLAQDSEGQLHTRQTRASFRHRTGKRTDLGQVKDLNGVHASLFSFYVSVRGNPLVAELDDDCFPDTW